MELAVRQAKPEDAATVADILTQATRYKVKHGDMAWGEGSWIWRHKKRLAKINDT